MKINNNVSYNQSQLENLEKTKDQNIRPTCIVVLKRVNERLDDNVQMDTTLMSLGELLRHRYRLLNA